MLLETSTVGGNAPKVPDWAKSAHSLFGSIGTMGTTAIGDWGGEAIGSEGAGGIGAGEAIGSCEAMGAGVEVGCVLATVTFESLVAGAFCPFKSSFCC